MDVRTVQDAKGVTWICLELPEVPVDQQHDVAGRDVVAIECNSGADRAIALVAPGWDEDLDDAALVQVITRALA